MFLHFNPFYFRALITTALSYVFAHWAALTPCSCYYLLCDFHLQATTGEAMAAPFTMGPAWPGLPCRHAGAPGLLPEGGGWAHRHTHPRGLR